jgi:hypothetical protein
VGVNLPHQMIFRYRITKVKLVEQLTLVTPQTARHGSTSPRIASPQPNHGSPTASTDFLQQNRQSAAKGNLLSAFTPTIAFTLTLGLPMAVAII